MKREITIEELREFYRDTLDKCGLFLLRSKDEDVACNIFEEFDIGVVTFLHERSLERLKNADLISEEVLLKSLELRKKTMALQNTSLWNISAVKNSKEWLEILELSDSIKADMRLKKP
ncbi:MAG: hypothetical protein FWG42_11975 [Clostridiales bacterium]|nr:hypothetical protein [Clostridiales bacterium]